jgi:uncharacterized membrane protein
MKNLAIMAVLLLGGSCIAILFGIYPPLSGRIGVALLFAFTGVGHFLKQDEMMEMLPLWVPARRAVVYASGIFELLGAIGVLIPASAHVVGIALCIFLVAATPLNIYAAFKKRGFSSASAGPAYLLARLPFQAFLFVWIYSCTIGTTA